MKKIFSLISKYDLVAFCSLIPAFSKTLINSIELPSIIGGSGPSICIKILSISKPTTAAKVCSTVLTYALFCLRVVPLEISETLSTSALINGLSIKSVL